VPDLVVIGLEHPGMDALVEPGAFFRMVEDDIAEPPPVDGTIRQLYLFAEMPDHLTAGVLAGSQEVMDDLVRVDDMRAQVTEDPGHEAFAAGDPTGETYNKHEPNSIYRRDRGER